MNSFATGFRNRSPLVMVAAALLMVPALVLLQSFFTSGSWSSVPLHFWLRHPHDDPGVVSWSVARLKDGPPRVPTVFIVGGSSAREGIVSGASLASDIRRLGGPRVYAANLSSSLRMHSQSLAIADNVPAEDAWLVVGISPNRFASNADVTLSQAVGKGMLLRSPYLSRYVARTYRKYRFDPTILPGIFLYLSDLADTYVRSIYAGGWVGGPYLLHRVDGKRPRSPERKQRLVRGWYRLRYPAFKENFAMNMGMLKQLVECSRKRGLHVVLVELPIDREIIGRQFDKPRSQYVPRVRRLARELGVPYLDFNADLAMSSEHFYDLQHLTKTGRPIWQERLARELVLLMQETDNEQDPP